MPVIPTFQSGEAYNPTPLPQENASTAGLSGNALADGMARVSAQFGQLGEAQRRAKLVQDATGHIVNGLTGLDEQTRAFDNDPDPATVGPRAKQALTDWSKQFLAGIEDEAVRNVVEQRLSAHVPATLASVWRQAAHRQQQNDVAGLNANVSTLAKRIADARTPQQADAVAEDLAAAIRGAGAAGTIPAAAADAALSAGLRQAILVRAPADPAAAKAMVERYRDRLTAQDLAQLDQHLKASDLDAQGAAIASKAAGGIIAPRPPPEGFDARFQRIIGQESNGQQFAADGQPLTSPKGAIGVAQVMPGTGPEAAQLAGLPWDENRYKTDRAYNQALGRAYYQSLETKYGNVLLAAAAYNAGPGRVDRWITTIGDPRTGQVSEQEWARAIPFAETRDYVRKVQAIGGGAPVPSRADALAAVIEQTKDNPQLQAAAIRHFNQFSAVEQARWVEAQRQDMLERKALQAAQEDAGNQVVTQLLVDPTKIDVVRDIANNPVMTAQQKLHLAGVVQGALKRDDGRDAATYGPGFWTIWQAVHAPENDPKRLTDPTALYPLGGPGGLLTVAGIEKLTAEIKGRRTPEGEAEALMKKNLLDFARKELVIVNPLIPGMKDPKGEEIFQRFLAIALPAYDTGRAAGKSPIALLNPDSPDYIGKAIGQLKRPLAQVMADQAHWNGERAAQGLDPAPTTAAKDTGPDLNTKEGILAAYRAGKFAREEATRRLIQGGFFPASPPAGPKVPTNP